MGGQAGGDRLIERLRRLEARHLWHPFSQMEELLADPPPIIERAEGSWLIDVEGRRYLDGTASLWVNVHGHRAAPIDEAIRRQLERVAHSTLLGLSHVPALELAGQLAEIAPGELSRCFFSGDGACAVEVAVKMAVQFWQQCSPPQPRRHRIVALEHAYHGDTIGAMGLGGVEVFRRAYAPLIREPLRARSPYCYRCDRSPERCGLACLEDLERLLERWGQEVAALVLEPMVQAAGGIIVFPPGWLRGAWELARRHGVLFIADEVAVGFGRTGRMFACEHEAVEPDLLVLGKGITGGYLPLSVTMATERIYRAFLGDYARALFHGHTYAGNPLACAAALANLELLRGEGVLEDVRQRARRWEAGLRRLRDLEHVGDVRALGLMAGVELVADRATKRPYEPSLRMGWKVCLAARRRGLIVRPLGDVVVLMPPLRATPEELELMVQIVHQAIEEVTCA